MLKEKKEKYGIFLGINDNYDLFKNVKIDENEFK